MKLFFASSDASPLLHPVSSELFLIKETILKYGLAEETYDPGKADAVIIQENNEYKDFRYVDKLLRDSFLSFYLNKSFTVSCDDSATGLFRGLYASMSKRRFDCSLHRAVPYLRFSNEFVFSESNEIEPAFLAGWYGNIKSSYIRKVLVKKWKDHPRFLIKHSQSWYNHREEEQRAYVQLIKDSKFSLCPSGWAPPSPRIYESMALGRCPVIISNDFVPPKGPKWEEFALFYPEKCITKIDSFLLQHEHRYKEMGERAKENWDKFFAGDLVRQYYANTLLDVIRSTPAYSKEEEIQRWRSFATFWGNNWAIPQRFVNKCKQFSIKLS